MIDEQKGIAEAESLLEDLGFNSLPITPQEVANKINDDTFQITIEEHRFDSDKFLGKAIGDDDGALIYINSNIKEPGRIKFTAAHELGHVCMHIMKNIKRNFECEKDKFSSHYYDPIEKQANGFASGLLMPKKLILSQINKEINWKNIKIIMNACGTSHEATFRRLTLLFKDPIALVIHKDGNFYRFNKTDNFRFHIERAKISKKQLELSTDQDEEYPDNYDIFDAADWVNPTQGYQKLETIYSSSIKFKNGYMYTLLSYDDDCLMDMC